MSKLSHLKNAVLGVFNKVNRATRKPSFYVPASSLLLASSILFHTEIRQTLGLEEKENILKPIPYDLQPKQFQYETAYHEAGHIIVAMAMRRPHIYPKYVTIRSTDESWGHVELHDNIVMAIKQEDYLAHIAIAYGGATAEECLLNSTTDGVLMDAERATECAIIMSKTGMGKFIPIEYERLQNMFMLEPTVAQNIQDEIIFHLTSGYGIATNVTTIHKKKIERLAQLLMKDRDQTLSYEEIKEFMDYDNELGLPIINQDGEKIYPENPIEYYAPELDEEQTIDQELLPSENLKPHVN